MSASMKEETLKLSKQIENIMQLIPPNDSKNIEHIALGVENLEQQAKGS